MEGSLLTVVLGLALAIQAGSLVVHPTISDRINDPKRIPGQPVVVGVRSDLNQFSLEDLTRMSELVVEATILRSKTYINDLDTAVMTDFNIVGPRVLAGTIPIVTSKPGAAPLVLTVVGGEVVKNGVTVRGENHNMQSLTSGGRYLLFLKRFGSAAGVYRLYNAGAFELSGNGVRPLARDGEELYGDFAKTPYDKLITRISAAARK